MQTINELTSRKSNTSSIKETIVNGVSKNKTTDLANAFNEHFSTIGLKLANEIPSEANGDKSCLEYLNITDQRFCFTPTNKITARLIRECADLICISICKIFNCSLTTGIFPDDWKWAKVTPLFKQGSSSDMNNYRPISVIPVMMCTIKCARTYQNIALFQKVNPDFAVSILRSLFYYRGPLAGLLILIVETLML